MDRHQGDISPDMPLFDVAGKRTAEMVRADLERVGIPYVDEEGRYRDFHGLRSTFITNLVKSGASPKVAQNLARHSTVELTLGTYTMLGVHDEAAAGGRSSTDPIGFNIPYR